MLRRPQIAYIAPNAIQPPNRGGRIRTHHLWRAMSAFADVTPIIVGDTPPAYIRNVSRAACAHYFPRRSYNLTKLRTIIEEGREPALPGLWEVLSETALTPDIWSRLAEPASLMRHCLNPARIERLMMLLRKLRPDAVVLCDSSVGLLAPHVRMLGLQVVVGPHNFDSALYATMAVSAPTEHLKRWNEQASKAFQAAESLYVKDIDQLWVCSRADADRFGKSGIPKDKIFLVPNVYDVGVPSPIPRDSNDLIFVGQANYYPNEDAILHLFAISRKLDERGIAHRMMIVGRIGNHIRTQAKEFPSVQVTGEVPAVSQYIEGAALAPIALTLGGGTRLKILEAMSMGRPVLSTPIGIEGIDVQDGVHAFIEPDLAAFAERIEELLQNRDLAQRVANAGWEFVKENNSHDALLRLISVPLTKLGIAKNGPSDESFARNIGASVRSEDIQFNPVTRLLTWTILLHAAVSYDCVSAEFDIDGLGGLANAFVVVKQRPRGYIGLEASAILQADCPPERAAISVYAWDRRIIRHVAPAHVLRESGGFLSVDVGTDGIRVLGWTAGSSVLMTPQPEDFLESETINSANCRVVRAKYSTPPTQLSLSTRGGISQDITDVRTWLGPHRLSTARLSRMKDIHLGESAWLIGNGPSVRLSDLNCLEGRLTVCFNRFHLAHAGTKLRPTYTITGDKQMIEDFGQQIVDESGGTVFIAHDRPPELLGDYIWLRQAVIFPPLFSRAADTLVSPGGSTPYVAMQLLYYMGVRKFYFYGADFSFRFDRSRASSDIFRTASGEGNHFIPNYRSGKPWCPPSLKDIGAAFLTARVIMESEGGFIRNVTRGGKLEIFERDSFDRALSAA